MIYYNWKVLCKVSAGCDKRLIKTIRGFYNKKKTLDIIKAFGGVCDSYILNGTDFTRNTLRATVKEQCVYLHIASYRNYLTYKLLGISYVDYSLISDIYELDKLVLNRLLTIKDNKIYFNYEDKQNMALKFGDTKGEAKRGASWYKIKDGKNVLRFVGDILPRYVYWRPNLEGKPTCVECLSFDRDKEAFINIEKDWFRHYFNEAGKDGKGFKDNCQWGYVVQVIDPEDGIVKPFGLKKKLFEAILQAASTLGDPTDIKTGWDVVFTKKKTGSQNFNVEYSLDALSCKKSPLEGDRLEAYNNMTSIDELVPRPTELEIHAFVKKNFLVTEKKEATVDPDDLNDFDDDVPY